MFFTPFRNKDAQRQSSIMSVPFGGLLNEKWLKNVSQFANVGDYLPIVLAALLVDMVILARVAFDSLHIKSLNDWYIQFGGLAVLADVLSIVIGVIIARFLYTLFINGYSLVAFLGLTVAVQFVHDVLFAGFFYSVPRGKSAILDVFKDYADEVGYTILFADAAMMVSTVLLGSYLANFSANTNIILLIVSLYILPYLLYTVKKI